MSVARAQREISGNEFAEWMAYDHIDPIGEQRADLRAGIIASTLANVHRPRGHRSYEPKDFMPDFEPKPPKTWQSMKAMLKTFANMQNQIFAKRGK